MSERKSQRDREIKIEKAEENERQKERDIKRERRRREKKTQKDICMYIIHLIKFL